MQHSFSTAGMEVITVRQHLHCAFPTVACILACYMPKYFFGRKKCYTPEWDNNAEQCRNLAQFITHGNSLPSKAIPFVKHADAASYNVQHTSSFYSSSRGWGIYYIIGDLLYYGRCKQVMPEQWPQAMSSVKTEIALAQQHINVLKWSCWSSDFPLTLKIIRKMAVTDITHLVWLSFSSYKGEWATANVPRSEAYKGNCI